MTEPVVVYPPAESALGFKSWVREFAFAAIDTIRPRPLAAEAPRGDGRPVLILPGFGSGDWANLRLRSFLRGLGYRAELAGILFNPGPAMFVMNRLQDKLRALSEYGPVSLVGVSLGGVLARDLARRHPEMTKCVVTLCSPVRFPITTPLQPFARVLSPLHASQWLERRHEIGLPLNMPVTAIHVTDDGVVERKQCWLSPSPGARNLVVEGRHMCAASNPQVLRVIADTLANC